MGLYEEGDKVLVDVEIPHREGLYVQYMLYECTGKNENKQDQILPPVVKENTDPQPNSSYCHVEGNYYAYLDKGILKRKIKRDTNANDRPSWKALGPQHDTIHDGRVLAERRRVLDKEKMKKMFKDEFGEEMTTASGPTETLKQLNIFVRYVSLPFIFCTTTHALCSSSLSLSPALPSTRPTFMPLGHGSFQCKVLRPIGGSAILRSKNLIKAYYLAVLVVIGALFAFVPILLYGRYDNRSIRILASSTFPTISSVFGVLKACYYDSFAPYDFVCISAHGMAGRFSDPARGSDAFFLLLLVGNFFSCQLVPRPSFLLR